MLRYSLMVCLLACAAFAAWSWLRPYTWKNDPAARCEIQETLVTKDRSYFWVEVHLKMNEGAEHDMQKPVRLEAASGKVFEPADSTFGGDDRLKPTSIWLKFWLEPADLAGPMTLLINDGKLLVKSGSEMPDLGKLNFRNYTSNHW